jgi:preprotein translocase SecE subunit
VRFQRYVLLSFVCFAVLLGWAVQAACVSAFAQFAILDKTIFELVSSSTLLGLATGLITFFVMIRSRKAIEFCDETVGELYKVTWPTKDETIRASTTVIMTTLFIAAVLAAYDIVWKNLADLVLFTEG